MLNENLKKESAIKRLSPEARELFYEIGKQTEILDELTMKVLKKMGFTPKKKHNIIKEYDLCEGVLLLSPIITFVDERIEMFDFLYECASKAMQEEAEKEKEMKKEWAPDHKDAEA